MGKSSIFSFKPEYYLVVIVILALFLVFRPDCTLLEGQTNAPPERVYTREETDCGLNDVFDSRTGMCSPRL